MNDLFVSIEMNGAFVPVGRICGTGPRDACFQYYADYIRTVNKPISISLSCRYFGMVPEE